MFLTKYNADGQRQWIVQLGTSSQDVCYDVALDSADNAYLVGYSNGMLEGQSNTGASDIAVVKIDSSGSKIWTRLRGSTTFDYGNAVAVDGNDNVYIIAGVESGGVLDGFTSLGGNDVVVLKFDSSGAWLWTRRIGSSSHDYGYGIAVASGANFVYISGHTNGGVDGNTNAGGLDVFVAAFSSAGAHQWTRQLGTSVDDEARSLAMDSTDNIYVAGSTRGNLGGNSNSGGKDVFLAKFDSDGQQNWTMLLGVGGDDRGFDVAVDSSDRVYVTGDTLGVLAGSSSAGNADLFVAVYAADGSVVSVSQLGSALDDRGASITVAPCGTIYVAGDTKDDIGTFINAGGVDIILVGLVGV